MLIDLRSRLVALLSVAGVLGLAVSGSVLASAPANGATPKLSYVAAGDSYSAGVGMGLVGPGCDRDGYAYGPRAVRDVLTAYSVSMKFIACSGATTYDIRTKQLPSVTSSTNVVSLTIGGNDIKFASKLKGCYLGACGPDVFSLKADDRAGSQTWDQLFTSLRTTYMLIRQKMAANGHVYVLTYPIPFSRETSSCNGFTSTEQNAANALVTRLDDTIYQAVKSANSLVPQRYGGRPGNIHFVDWRTGTRVDDGYTIPQGYSGAGKKFDTYKSPNGLCNKQGRTPYLNGYVATPDYMNSFHPNSTGYWKGATLFGAAVKKYQP